MKTLTLTIDGKEVETQEGKSVLEAALDAGIYIPHLCHHADLTPIGACRLCIVEIDGTEGLLTSCTTPVAAGMTVVTQSEQIDTTRRMAMELILAGHPADCGTCNKYLNCELQSLKQYLVSDSISFKMRSKLIPVNTANPLFLHEPDKCVVCGRCVRACHELRGVGVLHYRKRGKETYIGTAEGRSLAESGCRFCGACAEVCPTGAILDKGEFTQGKSRKEALVPCRYACPAEIDVPRYLRFIRNKDYAAATAVIREKVPFPMVLGYVCDHPCETACRRGDLNQAISIRNLKRFAVSQDTAHAWAEKSIVKEATDRKVAVIGSGPAGLTAAYYLANAGHTVVVFEALPEAGGMMRYGIPEYRLPKAVLDAEIKVVEDKGVEIRTDTAVEDIDALLYDEGFEAVVVAIGAQKGVKLPIAGADTPGVMISLDFLKDAYMGKEVPVGKRVLVLGGGNVAFDSARVARRLGAEEVHIACLECREDMPAACDEIEQGEEEGIFIHPSKTFTRILSEDGRITGVEFLNVVACSFDEDGKLDLETDAGSAHTMAADSVIFAVGQRPDIPETFELDLTERGWIDLDEYMFTTNRDEVFAAGDAVTGTASVIKAIASGRKAAIAVDRYLDGDGNIDEKLAPEIAIEKCFGPAPEFAGLDRCAEICLLPEDRIQNFCAVVDEMNAGDADYESGRCLRCDSRLTIKPVKFWGNY